MRLYEHLHPSNRKSGLKKYKNQGIYDNSDASSWSLLRNGLWISSVRGKNTNVTMENIPWLRTLGNTRATFSSPCTWIGIFIPDFGHSANNYAKLIFIKFVHPSTCNVFDAANEIAHDFYSTGSCFHGGRTGN